MSAFGSSAAKAIAPQSALQPAEGRKHELAIRSALLNVLADTPEADIGSLEGKERLQKRLTAAINQVLTKEEGFGGVDEVYFKSFLVQ